MERPRLDPLILGAILLGLLAGLAVFAPIVTPHDPIRQNLDYVHFSPNQYHPFGTDHLGRDVLSRVAWGARVSLGIAATATLLSAVLGTALGLAAAAAGGGIEEVLMRFVDLMTAFPALTLPLVAAALFRLETPFGIALVLGLTTWMPLARLVRAEAAGLSRLPYMEVAVGLGAGPFYRALRHIGPHVLVLMLVGGTLQAGEILLIESGLSFLGLGVASPTPAWGDMVRQGIQQLGGAWWVAAFPGFALSLAVLGLNLVGDGLRIARAERLQPGVAAGPLREDPLCQHMTPASPAASGRSGK